MRRFRDYRERNDVLVRNWNHPVKSQDEVYIPGEVTMNGSAFATEILSGLKGRKYLIRENRDTFVDNREFDLSVFEWVKDYYQPAYQKQKFILLHYPSAERNGYFRDAIQLHGHQHNHADYDFATRINFNNLEKGIRRFDVGVDANYMKPVSAEEIIAFFS